MLSARSLNVSEVGASWEPQHVIFTHGHGLAMAAAYDETATVSGESRNLDYLIRGLGESLIDGELSETLAQPRIYFGEDMSGYAIVGATREEVDFQTASNKSVTYRYTGEGGVPMGSFFRRATFALRFRELDPLISQNVTSESRAIYNREIISRADRSSDSIPIPIRWWPRAACSGLSMPTPLPRSSPTPSPSTPMLPVTFPAVSTTFATRSRS